jgi:glycosyltransferase involved in cell wall biosynthesis
MAPENVEYLGYVRDLDGLYANTRVVCCPMLNGGGTRVKLIEAAAYARPMVSTHIGAEGLDFEDGKEILLRDDDESFAEACTILLQDATVRRTMGLAARMRMQELYDADRTADKIRALMLRHSSAADPLVQMDTE